MIHSWAIGRIQGEFRFCGQGESTVDSIWEIYDFVRASGWVAIVSWRNVFCKHSVWISTTHFWGEPQTPEATQMLQFSQFRAAFIEFPSRFAGKVYPYAKTEIDKRPGRCIQNGYTKQRKRR